MAGRRPLDLTLLSARDLKNVNLFFSMSVYAVAWLSTDPRSRQRTPADRDGGRNPSWNGAGFRFFVPEGADAVLHVLLRSDRALGDRDVGVVTVPVKELVAASTPGADGSAQFVTYQVRRPSGRAKGVLNFSFSLGDPAAVPDPAPYPPPFASAAYPAAAGKASKRDEPVMAYPAGPGMAYPPPGAALPYAMPTYPLPHQPYGYGASPPPPGYAYPPPPAGYGYGGMPVVQAQPPVRNNFGTGLGVGLLGGALGGMLIGDMVSDAAAYDAGYDAGFDNAGGFDF